MGAPANFRGLQYRPTFASRSLRATHKFLGANSVATYAMLIVNPNSRASGIQTQDGYFTFAQTLAGQHSLCFRTSLSSMDESDIQNMPSAGQHGGLVPFAALSDSEMTARGVHATFATTSANTSVSTP